MLNMRTAWSFFVCFVVICHVACEDACEITRVEHGDVMTQELIPLRNSSGHQTGTHPIYLQVDIGSSEDSGSTLYIRCRNPYRFQGDRMRILAEITCTNGRWVPFPVCLLPACDKRSLNYRGLDKTGQKTFFHGESFMPMCQHDYKVSEKVDRRIHCENGRWTGNLPPCVEVTEIQCKLPQKPDFGSLELTGNSTTVGSVVTFKCDNGRKLVGYAVSTCNSSSEWTSPTPKCVAPCKIESLSDFEGLLVESCRTLDDGEWFQPKCDEGFEVSNAEDTRIYCRDGKWEGNVPPCSPAGKRGECEMPAKPEFGSALLAGSKPNFGSLVIYRCDPGWRLVGSSTSVCLQSGEWNFPAPLCVKPCIVPPIDHGELGKFEQRQLPPFRGTTFKKVSEGILDENEEATLRCMDGYLPKAIPHREVSVICRGGQLLPEPECVASACLDDPPPIENGKAVVIARNHGDTIWYVCEEGFLKQTLGNVECLNGSWVGTTPTCTETGKPMETEIPKADEVSSVSLAVLPTQEILKLSDGMTKKQSSNNSTKNEEVVMTDGTVIPPCSCKYNSRSHLLLAHDGKKLVKYGDEILSGSSIEFYCNSIGYVRLRGPPSITCPADCNWDSTMFPSCVSPGGVKGCAAVQRKPDSELLISPDKEFYSGGESITFSCPEGKYLTRDVERIMCLSSGWTPNTIPDCQ